MPLIVSTEGPGGPLPQIASTTGTYSGADADWTTGVGGSELGVWLTATAGEQAVISPHGSLGTAFAIDPADGNVHTGTATANTTVSITAPAYAGACRLEVWITQDGTGGRTVTWPGSVTFTGTMGTASGSVTPVRLETLDAGTTWYAWVDGGATAVAPGFATPAIVLGTAAAAGVATTTIRSDATILAFDATVPTDVAAAAAAGSAGTAAHRDHAHGGLGKPLALTGATAATRYAGATASGAPVSGTFAVGDFTIDQSGSAWVCTVAGTPGTWAQLGATAAIWRPLMAQDPSSGLWYVVVDGLSGSAVMTS